MNRSILLLNVLLLACFAALWGLDRHFENRAEGDRVRDSAFLLPGGERSPPVAAVARMELVLPGSDFRWSYVLRKDGWHIPDHRDAFALGQEIQGIERSFLESLGTIVGTAPAEQSHFGLERSDAMEAAFFDSSDKLLLRAWAGVVVPGQRASECFMTAAGGDLILHVHANPWSFVSWTPGGKLPPLLDPKVIPVALGRGGIAHITFGGREPPPIAELIRREIPQDLRQRLGPDRGPRYEWYGKLPGGEEKRVNDSVAWAYASSILGLTFDELLGARSGREALFEPPAVSLALQYDGDAKDTLVLGGVEKGNRYLLNSTTGQVFLISLEKAKGLSPDVTALLELPPEKPPAGK
jgi:hypothetical protein